MSARARFVSNIVFFAIIVEVLGGTTTDSWNPISFFGQASTGILIVLSVLALFSVIGVLQLLTLMALRSQGLTDETTCGYDECPWKNVPLLQGVFLGRGFKFVKCYGNPHPSGRDWFHSLCWQKMEGDSPSRIPAKNVCRRCRSGDWFEFDHLLAAE
jgi:hypothetical protein